MNRENMIKYLEALESGAYPQDPRGGRLKTEAGYCCLGVLEEIRGSEWVKAFDGTYALEDSGRNALPSKAAVTKFLGIPSGFADTRFDDDFACGSISVTLDNGDEIGVHSLNDSGATFKEIAQLIRSTYL